MQNLKEVPKIVFMGNPVFAVPTMVRIHKEFPLQCVVTSPERPQGRGLKSKPQPVNEKAKELGIPVIEVDNLKDPNFIEHLQVIRPDIIVVLGFKILPAVVFEIARIATFNIHPSLLPKYRGPAPINWTIINGDTKTGITTFIIQKEVDKGNILIQKEIEIPEGLTAGDLEELLAPLCGEIAIETIYLLLSGNYQTIRQDDSQATKAPKIFPEQCQIDWNKSAKQVRNFIHGVSPEPGAWTIVSDKRLKIFRCEIIEVGHDFPSGTIVNLGKKLGFACEDGFVVPQELKFEGKKLMDQQAFFNGYAQRLVGECNSFRLSSKIS